MADDRILTPDYLSADFDSYVERQTTILKNTDTFKDYNYEGSNVKLLMEWFAYNSDLSTFYSNKIAKNVYDDTVDIYENAHRLARQKGYNARGYVSSRTDLNVIINVKDELLNENFVLGDQIYIPAWSRVYATVEEADTQEIIQFIVPESQIFDIPFDEDIYVDGSYTVSVPVVQGELYEGTYKGTDLVDNKIVLPFYQFNHDFTDTESDSNMILEIDGQPWTRVENFQSELSGLVENNITDDVFMLTFDKYKRYVLEFSSFRNVPDQLAEIQVSLLISEGSNGNVGTGLINTLDDIKSKGLVYNNTRSKEIPLESITITNPVGAEGGTDPQEISQITEAGKGFMNSQERCVTKNDYISFLKSRSDIVGANVWGEQELENKGNINEYNKVHISLIPFGYNTGTIETSATDWTPATLTGEILTPINIADSFKLDLKSYLEPRKILTTYEEFELPELVYFAFVIGIKVKRLYNFADVAETVREKLAYYFEAQNRTFNEKISFNAIHNFILDQSQKATGKNWELIKGIDNLIFRSIFISVPEITQEKIDFYALPEADGGEYEVTIPVGTKIYPPNNEGDFPRYTRDEFLDNIENKLKVIELGHNQFPYLATDICVIEQEVE